MLGLYPISALPISGLAWVYQLGEAFRIVEMSEPVYAVADLSEGIAL
jgi:hypothetical protein